MRFLYSRIWCAIHALWFAASNRLSGRNARYSGRRARARA